MAHVLLAGGGTGGHVFPALAVAEVLRERGWAVSFTGSARGLEARLVPRRGIDFHPLPARPLAGRGAWGKARALTTVATSAWRARGLMRRLGVDAVLGTGGYVSAPAVVGARLARRPALLFEPNAEPGVANRWLSRLAAGAAVAYAEAGAGMGCPARVTGTPVRRAFFAVPEGLPDGARRLLVLGGSQGSRQLNRALPAALARLLESPRPELSGLAVLHQCGAAHLEETRRLYADLPPALEVEVAPFLDDVASAMAASHLVVSRAGALTLAEICAAGRAALLVPLRLAGDHQGANARALERAGAACRITPRDTAAECLVEPLAAELAALLADRPRLAAMARSARALAVPGAAEAIADQLRDLLGEATR